MSQRRKRTGQRRRKAPASKDDLTVTIGQYGPDDKTVTKIVAGAVRADGRTEALKRWVGTDVATSPGVREEIVAFIESLAPAHVVVTMGVTGCIHEEGEDYPSGQACPFCLFWKDRDRWATAKPIAMTLAQFRRRVWPQQ